MSQGFLLPPSNTGTAAIQAIAADTLTQYTSGTVMISGATNVTVQTVGQTILLSAGGGAGGFQSAGMSTQGNTAGTTGLVGSQLLIAGGANITLSQSVNGASASLTIVGGAGVGGGVALAAGASTYTSGTVVLAQAGLVSLSPGAQSITISARSESLNEIQDPAADKVFQMGTNQLQLQYVGAGGTFSTNATRQGMFEVDVLGNITDGADVVHIHQSVGAAAYAVDLLHLEAAATGVTALRINAAASVAGELNAPLKWTSGSVPMVLGTSQSNSVANLNAQYLQGQGSATFQDTLGMSNLGNTAGTSGVVSGPGVRMLLAGGANITLSQSINGSSATVSIVGGAGAAAGSGTLGMSNLGNTSGTSGTIAGSNFQFLLAGGDNITLSQSINGSSATVTISAAAGGGAGFSLGVSTGGNTTGNTGTVASILVLVGGSNITLSQDSVNTRSATVTINGPTPLQAGVSDLGNTNGTTGIVSNSLVFAGTNNITLRQSSIGASPSRATISISGPDLLSVGISAGIGNTSGDTGVFSRQVVLAGGSNVTLAGNTGLNGSMTVSVVGAHAHRAFSCPAGVEVTASTVELQTAGQITISALNAASIRFSVPSYSQTAGISNLGNTAGTSGVASGSEMRLLFAGGNNITLSQSLNGASATITISGAATAAQSAESQTLGISNLGNTLGTSGVASGAQVRYLFAGGNNITLSQSLNGASGTVTISAFSQTAESQTLGMSNLGNTVGTSGVASGAQVRFLLAGGNNITLSQSLNGASGTLTISAAAQSAASQTFGMSNLGNTSGTSGVVSGDQIRFLLAGGNGITLSQSLNGASGTITISAGAGGAGMSAGVSNLGNTAGTTGTVTGQVVYVGSNNITLSQSSNAGNATVTIYGPSAAAAPNLLWWVNVVRGSATQSAATPGTASMEVRPLVGWAFGNAFPGNMSVSTMGMLWTFGGSTSSSYSSTIQIGFYSRVNLTQLTLLYQASSAWNLAADANNSISLVGPRWVTFHSSQFSNETGGTLSAIYFSQNGEYYWGWRNSSNNFAMSPAVPIGEHPVAMISAQMSGVAMSGGTTNTGATRWKGPLGPWYGMYSNATNAAGAMPASIAKSHMSMANLASNSLLNRILAFNNLEDFGVF